MIQLSMNVEAGMANSKTEALINKEVDDLIDKGHVTEQDLRVINLSCVCVSPCGATSCLGEIGKEKGINDECTCPSFLVLFHIAYDSAIKM